MSELYGSQAVKDVLNERERQIQIKGWTSEHDDKYEQNELVRAGAGYANHVVERGWVYSDYGAEAYQDEEVPDFGLGVIAIGSQKPKTRSGSCSRFINCRN